MGWYPLIASPTLYAGQTVRAGLSADQRVEVNLFIQLYDRADNLDFVEGPSFTLETGAVEEVSWLIPDTAGQPIAGIGVAYFGQTAVTVYVDYVDWTGEPDLNLTRPQGAEKAMMWRRAWVDGIDLWQKSWPEPFRLVQNEGRGLLMQGTREWTDYEVQATITPALMSAGGIGIRAQGMRRYYALLLCERGTVRLIKALDSDQTLGQKDYGWQAEQPYELRLQAQGAVLRAWINGELLFEVEDGSLAGGAAAFVLQEGHMVSHGMAVRPVSSLNSLT